MLRVSVFGSVTLIGGTYLIFRYLENQGALLK